MLVDCPTCKPPNRKGIRHQQHCLHDEPGVTVCTCGGNCPDCVGGRVVSESVIEEMGRAIFDRDDAYQWEWESYDEGVHDWYRDKARAAGRVMLEHMEKHTLDNADKVD